MGRYVQWNYAFDLPMTYDIIRYRRWLEYVTSQWSVQSFATSIKSEFFLILSLPSGSSGWSWILTVVWTSGWSWIIRIMPQRKRLWTKESIEGWKRETTLSWIPDYGTPRIAIDSLCEEIRHNHRGRKGANMTGCWNSRGLEFPSISIWICWLSCYEKVKEIVTTPLLKEDNENWT
jgi:hypothetical protein